MSSTAAISAVPVVDWDALHNRSLPETHWTTTNAGEAMPGVMSPMSWSIWGPGAERGIRAAAFAVGVLSSAERQIPQRAEDRWVSAFYGRAALRVEALGLIGDRMPGTSGAEAVSGLLGPPPETLTFAPTRARYPAVALRFPRTFAGFPARLAALVARQEPWWSDRVGAAPELDIQQATALLEQAEQHFNEAETLQSVSAVAVVGPAFDILERLVARTGVGDVGILSGTGGAEMDVVTDIWRASRGEVDVAAVVRRHGFHGPREGELSTIVWREDRTPIARMIEQYALRPDSQDPRLIAGTREPVRLAMERELVAALPRLARTPARHVMSLARARVMTRGVAKRAFLQALDVARAAARQIGRLQADAGRLDDPEDIFLLTAGELRGGWPADARELVERRRDRAALYAGLELPEQWRGQPVAVPLATSGTTSAGALTGLGVSSGVAEGRVRVVLDPSFADVEPDEILVAATTDPSWASIMFVSAGLVMDIGGALSHAAVVARELQIPCVVNTRTGTTQLHTGDHIRVDGNAGTVEVLARHNERKHPS